MPQEQDKDASAAYKPTSLDFINLPNPIQPVPQFQRHPLNGTPRLGKALLETVSNQNLFDLILDPSTERPSKRQKAAENPLLDLPKLPVRNNAKRNRLPPTLSGLHQPPPDAGLLPSINVEQPEVPPPRPKGSGGVDAIPTAKYQAAVADSRITAKNDEAQSGHEQKRHKRNKWTEEETQCLLKGVEQFGIGSWTKILKHPEYTFNKRTALDLKDRFRICCPDHYKRTKVPKYAKAGRYDEPDEQAPIAGIKSNVRGTVPERVSSSAMKKFGVTEPFVKSTRRQKTSYTSVEDDALLKGFKRYGKSWSSIRNDRTLGLSDRQATNLRDRMRTRFPHEYSEAGLALKLAKPYRPEEASDHISSLDANPVPTDGAYGRHGKDDSINPKPAPQKRPPQPQLFSLDDIYLGPLLGDDDDNAEEPITLDRGILDWATADNTRTALSDPSRSNGINPMVTLNLPKPNPVASTSLPGFQASSGTVSNVTSLPSLATLLPADAGTPDQLELPSLIPLLGTMETDVRSGGSTFPTLDELLS